MSIGDYIISVCAIITALLTIIEKSQSIKWKPLSSLFGINKLNNKIDHIEEIQKDVLKRQNNLHRNQLLIERDDLRGYLILFASELRNNVPKTDDEYEEFFRRFDKYEDILKELQEKNGFVLTEVEYVKKVYNERGNTIELI